MIAVEDAKLYAAFFGRQLLSQQLEFELLRTAEQLVKNSDERDRLGAELDLKPNVLRALLGKQ